MRTINNLSQGELLTHVPQQMTEQIYPTNHQRYKNSNNKSDLKDLYKYYPSKLQNFLKGHKEQLKKLIIP